MRKKLFILKICLTIIIASSVWIILSIKLEIFPLIESNFSTNFIIKLNQILLNLSYSVLAAYIFYLITYTIPKKIHIYHSKQILAKKVHTLLYELFVIISHIKNAYKIDKEILRIEEKDLLHINGNTSESFEGVYKTGEHYKSIFKKGKQFTGFANLHFKFPDILYKKLSEVPKKIIEIRRSNPQFYIDEVFAEILASLETNKTIEHYSNGKNQAFLFADSSESLISLIKDYKRLLKLNYHILHRNSYQTIHFYTKEEIKNIPNYLQTTFGKINSKITKSRNLNPSIIFNPNYSDNRAIIAILNQGGYVTKNQEIEKEFLLSEYNYGISTPEHSKCIVLLTSNIPKKSINEIVKSNKNDKIIILIKPNIFYSSSKLKGNKSYNCGVYTIYYRKPFGLKPFKFFESKPTKSDLSIIRNSITTIMKNSNCKSG